MIKLATLLKEEETAWHGSSNYFRKFKTLGVGGGTGTQVYGWGLYFGKNPGIAKGYTTAGSNANKKKSLFQGKTAEELGLEYENEVFFGLPEFKTAKEYIEYAEEMINLLKEEGDFEGKEEIIKNYERFIETIKNLKIEQEPMQYMYAVTLFPNKNPDYLDWDSRTTPQNQVDKINKQAQKENLNFQVKTDIPPSVIYENVIENYFKKNGSSNPPKDTSNFLLRAGIDGNTHSNGDVRIVFDDSEIRIDKIYKMNEFNTIQESKKRLLKEYSEKIIKDLITKWQAEMRNTLSNDDIREKINQFKRIANPGALGKKIEAGIEKKPGGIIVPKKFTEPDPKTGKVLDPLSILNYTWKDLETVLDAYGTKAEKTTKDFKTVQDAELMEIKGAPTVYSGNGIKIYEGSNYEGCIRLNYAFKYKGEDDKIYSYSFCIGRKEPGVNQYYTYRFGRGGSFRSFYFVADSTQPADIKGDPSNRENFVNWYHFFVIHVFDDGKFGVTDAVNVFGGEHESTGNDRGISWEDVGKFMIKNGGESGKKAWDKIKNLKSVFKYVSPSEEENDQALVQNRVLNFEQFSNLNRNQKRIYIAAKADNPLAFNSEMFRILDIELKNLAIRTGKGFKPTFNDIKDNPSLLRSYARFRYTRSIEDIKNGNNYTTIVPLPFIPYLTEDEKQQYLDYFEDNVSFELIEKYFGKDILDKAVNKQAKDLGFINKEYIKYISDPKLKKLYESYSKLYDNWEKDKLFNNDKEIENSSSMPEQRVDPRLITYKQWLNLSTKEKDAFLKLLNKVDGQLEKYTAFLYSMPFVIKDGSEEYFLLPKTPYSDNNNGYSTWVLLDKNNKIIKDNIDGESSILKDKDLLNGYIDNFNPNRIYSMNDVKLNSENLQESNGLYEDWDRYQLMIRAGIIK